MIKNLKINTALLLSTVFIFRILFINLGIISFLNSQQNTRFVKSYASSIVKERRYVDAVNTAGNFDYSVAEICEEDADTSNQIKLTSFFLIQILYSALTGKLESGIKKIASTCASVSHPPSERYSLLQVFRI